MASEGAPKGAPTGAPAFLQKDRGGPFRGALILPQRDLGAPNGGAPTGAPLLLPTGAPTFAYRELRALRGAPMGAPMGALSGYRAPAVLLILIKAFSVRWFEGTLTAVSFSEERRDLVSSIKGACSTKETL
ncbi:hypothetical protein EAH_00016850 [Eimeria acervulina]|uniref:Uncharacterized protein n=1 Tax=Eimeria acervulina TaxID=5801 RepID=U6G7J9_EIMAC|nr:hypothetical protein EAH_00016850 [Eimeria acervulina]CDI76226.1 hypothetical protein EAH_00016850 [Eimeria acervulina]